MWWLVIAIPAVVLAGLALLGRIGARERRRTQEALAAIASLSDAEAERRALELLGGPLFLTRAATRPFEDPRLPPQVIALLNRYEEVRCGEFWVGVAALGQHARLPGFIKIGEDMEFTEILVRPGDSKIYVSYGEGPATLETENTIWHEIIVASGEAAGLASS